MPSYFKEFESTKGGSKLNMSTVLRNGNTYFQMIEKYSTLLRKTSFLHPSILNEMNPELDELVNKIDTLIIEVENSDPKTEKLFDLRRLVLQLEDMVDFKAIQRYNQRIDGIVETKPAAAAVNHTVKPEEIPLLQTTASAPAAANGNGNGNGVKTPKDVWEGVTKYLKEQLNVHTYNVWVKPVEFHSCEDNKIKILVQNQFYKNWLEDHCYRLIKKHLDDIDSDYEVTFVTK
ncbi:MAG: DnaA N-terminal domain-containing protein [Pseudomonadota bacterium]